MTFLAALRHDRVEAPWLLDGPINGERFRLYEDCQEFRVAAITKGRKEIPYGPTQAAGDCRPGS
jgi:hypothetical protein